MNKYQEALDKVKSVPLFIEPKEDRNGWKIYLEVSSIEEKNKTDIDVLQELVDKAPYYKELEDKATPKKPLNIWYGLTEQVGNCPNCDKKLFESVMELAYSKDDDLEYFKEVKLSNCNRCGQAIDWSKDE